MGYLGTIPVRPFTSMLQSDGIMSVSITDNMVWIGTLVIPNPMVQWDEVFVVNMHVHTIKKW